MTLKDEEGSYLALIRQFLEDFIITHFYGASIEARVAR